ncbi:MAG: hypothetical protein AAGA54_25455 [Myxococcota bacterium]
MRGHSLKALAVAVLCGTGSMLTPATADAAALMAADDEDELEEQGFTDPRLRRLPRKHRFRLGLQTGYMRMSAAIDEDTGEVQRFHFVPLQLDFGYQARIGKFVMVRPSLAVGANVGNTLEAMPLVIHPQLFAGYQGRLVGVAAGYGYLGIPITNKDAVSEIRGGLGQPIISRPHQIGAELSFTTRVHQRREHAPGAGELSIILRLSGVRARTQHFEVDNKRWRAMFTFNLGWYFGDGRKARARRAAAEG